MLTSGPVPAREGNNQARDLLICGPGRDGVFFVRG